MCLAADDDNIGCGQAELQHDGHVQAPETRHLDTQSHCIIISTMRSPGHSCSTLIQMRVSLAQRFLLSRYMPMRGSGTMPRWSS